MVTGAALVIAALDLFDRPMPRLQTTDGDELVFADVRFDIIDSVAIDSALSEAPDLEREAIVEQADEVAYAWLESGRDSTSIRALGRVIRRSTTLSVETTSMARAQRAQEYFSALAPGALRLVATDVASFEEVPGSSGPAADGGGD